MSIVQNCLYDESEKCKYEIFVGEPNIKKCKFCNKNSVNKRKQVEEVNMFEKEAEEWRNSLPYGIDNDTFYNIAIPCMEFGYNKAKEEMQELKELVEKYRQAVDKCLHITFMGGGCEVNTIGQYATLVDGYLTDVEGLAKWKN